MPVICKTFRVGVFFDGTGNNKANDIRANAARKRQQNLHEDQRDSEITEANAPSNIAKLSMIYPNGETLAGQRTDECEIRTEMIYIEGLGTNDNEGNYTTGLAGGSEGALRINEALQKVLAALSSHGESDYNRVIDVFGFSRGAAQARDFINTFNKRYSQSTKNYKFGFIGLYDTVGSFGIGGNSINFKPKDPVNDSEMHPDVLAYESGISRPGSPSQQNLHNKFEEYNFNLSAKSSEKLVHLTAADEYRGNFPLTNIKGSAGLEAKLIGVHSDVGGGYPPLSDESKLHDTLRPSDLSFYKDNSWGLHRLISSDTGVENPIELANEAARAKEAELGRGWKCKVFSISRRGVTRANVTCTQRHDITDDLQNVGLAAMHVQGKLAGVPFKALTNLNVPHDLLTYHAGTVQSPASASRYSPRQHILTYYAHRSSYDSEDALHGKNAGGFFEDYIPNEMRYENGRPRREIYDNVPAKAIT